MKISEGNTIEVRSKKLHAPRFGQWNVNQNRKIVSTQAKALKQLLPSIPDYSHFILTSNFTLAI